MKLLNYGSLNIDYVYGVSHIARPGETISSASFRTFAGGKGANQSVALARAGAPVAHAGKVGPEGKWLAEKLTAYGVDTRFIRVGDSPSGHAIIQVDPAGENAIVLFPGANRLITREEIAETLKSFSIGDILLVQNEINELPFLLEQGRRAGLRVCFNPAPFGEEVRSFPLENVDILIVNRTEGEGLSGENEPGRILAALGSRLPRSRIILTLGANGGLCAEQGQTLSVPAHPAKAVDTTAAGDTFIGYYLAGLIRGEPTRKSIETACRAAALCVSRPGAMDSIPEAREL